MATPPPYQDAKRRYWRIPSIIPVDYQISQDGKVLDPEIRTGFTRDLSEAGLCLSLTTLPEVLARPLDEQAAELTVTVDLRLRDRPLRISGRVVWSQVSDISGKATRLVGVEFQKLSAEDGQLVAVFARRAAARPKIAKAVILSLCAAVGLAVVVFAVGSARHQREIAVARDSLAKETSKRARAAAELERLYVEARWVANELEWMAADMRQDNTASEAADSPPENDEPPLVRPAIEDLATNVATLRRMVDALKQQRQRAPNP